MSKVPTVINRHHYRRSAMPTPSVYIGRGTPLGNPFTVQEHGKAALSMYRRWLWQKIVARDPDVMRALAKISASHHLVCSCKPRPCHGDVVVAAWRWLQTRKGPSA